MTQAEKFPDPFLLKSDVNLFNHWLGKRMLRVAVLRVLFFVDMRLPVFSVADLYCLKLLYVVDADHSIRYLRHN